MDVDIQTPQGWRDLGKRFRAASNGKAIRRELTKAMRAAAKPAEEDLRKAILAVDSKGVGGGGTTRRRLSHQINRPKSKVRAFGLRATIARGIRSQVSYSGFKVGLRMSLGSKHMPNRQRKLPKYLDGRGRWRHPLFGDRERWYDQTGHEYFNPTMRKHTPKVRAGIVEAVNTALKELQS